MSNPDVIGIDLGTTHSLVAIVENGVPHILLSREGQRLLPSVFTILDGKPVLGFAAKKEKLRHASQTVFSIKRLLGKGLADVAELQKHLPYPVTADAQGMIQILLGDRYYTAIEISALILAELKKAAEEDLGRPIKKAVITVPAYFNDAQRQATRTAGRLAGLEVLRIVNEPTAASLAYGLQEKREGIIAVYDLGGGTFDLSILKLHQGIFEVLATHGDTELGGDDLDRALFKVLAKEIQDEKGIDVYADPEWRARLLEGCEAAKCELSEDDEYNLDLDLGGEVHFKRRIFKTEFETMIRPLLMKTKNACLIALKDAGLTPADITDVVLVGGSTRIPLVKSIAGEIFGRLPNVSMNPDEVVAAGAAIQGDILAGGNSDFLLLDVVPLSLGIETYGGLMSVLIPRNTRIPTSAQEQFTTFVDNQTGVDVHVYQGEREKVEENRSLARFKLWGIEPNPAGFPRIEVQFQIDADGILQVSAKDLRTGKEQSIEVRPSFGLSEDQVAKMLDDAEKATSSDLEFRRWIEVKTQAEPVLRAAEKKLPDAKRLLPELEFQKIESLCASMRQSIVAQDPEKTQNLKYELNHVTMRLAELILQEALKKR